MDRCKIWCKMLLAALLACGTALAGCGGSNASAAAGAATAPASVAAAQTTEVGEKVPSDDPVILNFHALGRVAGEDHLFRSASPLRDLEVAGADPGDPRTVAAAHERLKHMADLGIRTIVSLENEDPESGDTGKSAQGTALTTPWIELEKREAAAVGVNFVALPMSNSGPHSLQTMSDVQVAAVLDRTAAKLLSLAREGGVDFHCTAGHDRTGIVTAYIRMKYEHWPVEEAIAEMRRFGHDWPIFSNDGGATSWHEDHLRAIAGMLGTK